MPVRGRFLPIPIVSMMLSGLMHAQSIRVDPPGLVARATGDHPFDEPQLVIDQHDPNHWVGIVIVRGSASKFPDVLADQRCAAFVSFDAGKAWTRHDFQVTACVDPWVVLTDDGQAVASMMGTSPAIPNQSQDGLLLFRSSDGGRTWPNTPVGLGSFHDHPVMAIDLHSSAHHNWVYVSSHRGTRGEDGERRSGPWIARSRDGGKSFDDPVTVIPNNVHNFTEMPVVLSDGTLVVSFVDAQYSTDQPNRVSAFERRRAWVIRSTDGGRTFSIPLFVNDACGPPPAFRLSAMVADASSSSFRDRLYFACRAKGGGAIVVNHSADRGERWSTPLALHAAAGESAAEERIPGLATNTDGTVAVAWIDGRSADGHRCEQSVYVTASVDGGQSFPPAVRVSSAPPCEIQTRPRESPTGGDYFGLAATPDGVFHLLWVEVRDGLKQLMTTAIHIDK